MKKLLKTFKELYAKATKKKLENLVDYLNNIDMYYTYCLNNKKEYDSYLNWMCTDEDDNPMSIDKFRKEHKKDIDAGYLHISDYDKPKKILVEWDMDYGLFYLEDNDFEIIEAMSENKTITKEDLEKMIVCLQ